MRRRAHPPQREAWLFAGGTALGAVQLYTAEQLAAARVAAGLAPVPDLVAGVSVGSLTGLLAAQGRLDRLRELWADVDGARWFQRLAIDFDPLDGLYTLAPLRRRIERETRYPLTTELRVGLVHLRAKRYRSILANGLNRQRLADALIASCTQPGIHEEVTWEGRKAGDGGLLHVMPYPEPIALAEAVAEAVAEGTRAAPSSGSPLSLAGWTMHAVLCTPADRRHSVDQGEPVRAVTRALECLVDVVIRADVARLQRWADLGAEVYLYDPPSWPGDPFDADRDTIAWRIDEVGPEVWASRRRLDGGA